MTVEELIAELRGLPPTAMLVFRHTRDDIPDDYDTVDVFYDSGEVFIDIHSEDDDEDND